MTVFTFPAQQIDTTGLATEAKQDDIITALNTLDTDLTATNTKLDTVNTNIGTTNTTLSTIDGKITAVDTGNVTVVASALPTGAASEATLSTLNGKVTAVDTGNVTIAASALPTGAATESTLSTLNAKVTAVDTGNVTIAATTGKTKAHAPTVNVYSSTNVTSSAYVELISSTSGDVNLLEIFDSSGVALYLATGAAASEVDQLIIYPGGNGAVSLHIPSGTRISLKAVSTSATAGTLYVNLYS